MLNGQSKKDILLLLAERIKDSIGNLSLRKFATRCDFSDSVLRRYIAGTSEPGIIAIMKMAEVANVTVEWLATGRGRKTYAEPDSVQPMNKQVSKGVNTKIDLNISHKLLTDMYDSKYYKLQDLTAAVDMTTLYNMHIDNPNMNPEIMFINRNIDQLEEQIELQQKMSKEAATEELKTIFTEGIDLNKTEIEKLNKELEMLNGYNTTVGLFDF